MWDQAIEVARRQDIDWEYIRRSSSGRPASSVVDGELLGVPITNFDLEF